jgi:hypothetical protein
MRQVAVVFVLFFATGCSHTYELARPTMSPHERKLTRSDTVYIALPEDGVFEGRTVYEGSGQHTADVLQAAFQRHLRDVRKATTHESPKAARVSARNAGASCLVYPELLHWEDRQTAWSGLPDRIRVRISIVDLERGDVIDSVEFSGKSKWATFGGDDPKDLVEVPVNQYVDSLF